MAEVLMRKLSSGALVPADEAAEESLRSVQTGGVVRCNIVRVRNYKLLQKYMVLVRLLYDIWTETAPRLQYRGQDVAPNIDKFRGDLQILCGFYDPVFGVRGELQLKPKSISFASMTEEEFASLFSTAIDVALAKILNRPDWTEEKIRQACEDVIRFSG